MKSCVAYIFRYDVMFIWTIVLRNVFYTTSSIAWQHHQLLKMTLSDILTAVQQTRLIKTWREHYREVSHWPWPEKWRQCDVIDQRQHDYLKNTVVHQHFGCLPLNAVHQKPHSYVHTRCMSSEICLHLFWPIIHTWYELSRNNAELMQSIKYLNLFLLFCAGYRYSHWRFQ